MAIIRDQQAYVLAIQYNFLQEVGGKYEPNIIAGTDDAVFILAHRPTSNNCKFKFNPQDLEDIV